MLYQQSRLAHAEIQLFMQYLYFSVGLCVQGAPQARVKEFTGVFFLIFFLIEKISMARDLVVPYELFQVYSWCLCK